MRLVYHSTAFFHTLGQHIAGGQHCVHFWRVRGYLERLPQWKTCAHYNISRLHFQGSLKNQAGTQPAISHITPRLADGKSLTAGGSVCSRKLSSGGVSPTPNVLPVLGVSPKLFPLCVITEWMTNGNIMEFTPKHPEVNRLHLVCAISPLFS